MKSVQVFWKDSGGRVSFFRPPPGKKSSTNTPSSPRTKTKKHLGLNFTRSACRDSFQTMQRNKTRSRDMATIQPASNPARGCRNDLFKMGIQIPRKHAEPCIGPEIHHVSWFLAVGRPQCVIRKWSIPVLEMGLVMHRKSLPKPHLTQL